MKKIMIYSKHSSSNSFREALNNNAGIIMYYAIFVCGLIFGCTLYNSLGENSYLERAANIILSNNSEKNLAILAVLSLITMLIAITGALSCAGVGLLCAIPGIGGFLYSQIAADLIANNAAKGLGYLCLIILPGSAIMMTAIIALCAESGNISKKLALTNIFSRREEIDFRGYFIKCVIIIVIMLFSILLNYICVKLFSKLF
ncbi:MAG: hypothetical protein J1E34_03360 [Oscillospiraceae bacterium]|nr:hypothetical protein [Oscillospiraceae bacterium]